MRIVVPLLVCLAACQAHRQVAREEPAPGPAAPAPAPVAAPPTPAVIGDDVAVEYRPQAGGQALIEVASPAGTRVDVREGEALIGRDSAPMTVKGEADHWYSVAARLPSGAAREAKVLARAGEVASLSFTDVTPQGPKAMSREAFKDLVRSMDEEAGDQARLNLLRSAAAHEWFTAAMAGVLIDHVAHRESKLAAVPVLKDRILDRENAFWLYQHFTWREDKAKVQEMLEH